MECWIKPIRARVLKNVMNNTIKNKKLAVIETKKDSDIQKMNIKWNVDYVNWERWSPPPKNYYE